MTTNQKKGGLLSHRIFNSRIHSANTQASERWLGYFFGPAVIYIAYYCMAGTYLNTFYVDVVKLGGVAGGAFLVLLPICSKVFDAITNIVMGQIIDHTHTAQGKVRPWILLAAPLVGVTGLLLYLIPHASTMVQVIWVGISYNLYFAFAFTIYNMSQTLLIPLSTRNVKQRDKLALFISMGQSMLPGALVYLVFPLVALPWMGISASRWATVMSVISIICIPAILLQYYFTKERVTEAGVPEAEQSVPLLKQLKTCLSDKYWLIYFAIFFFYQFQNGLYSNSIVFYANWVLGSYNDGITQTLINAIGQMPLGLGVFLLWPIAKKFGKRKTFFTGMLLAAVACIPIVIRPSSMAIVLVALFFKSFGMLPTYLFMSMLADAMDHIEWKNGFRCDGMSATFNSIMLTVMTGVATGVFNIGIAKTGYVAPVQLANGTIQTVVQSSATRTFFVVGFALVPAICFAVCAVFSFFFDVEKDMPQIASDIVARHRAEAEARGEVYVSPEELAAAEQAENDRLAEEKRIEELKTRCVKKGLVFEEEEAKYQAKLAAAQAKAEAKAAKRQK